MKAKSILDCSIFHGSRKDAGPAVSQVRALASREVITDEEPVFR